MTSAAALIDFDRTLRLLVLDGIEKIEVPLRTQIGYQFGRRSAFAHLDPALFTAAFTAHPVDPDIRTRSASAHEQWLGRMGDRQNESDEAFVAHFRDKYDDQMPIWALTEITEMGHLGHLGRLGRLHRGTINSVATELAHSDGAPSKKAMQSWIGNLIYVRNAPTHHAPVQPQNSSTLPHHRSKVRARHLIIFGMPLPQSRSSACITSSPSWRTFMTRSNLTETGPAAPPESSTPFPPQNM